MLRAVAIALLALAACACSKQAPSTLAPATATPATATQAAATQAAAAGAAPLQPAPSTAPPSPLANPLNLGSQEAKDDLYCSGVIFFRYGPTSDALSPTEEAIRMRNEGMGMIIAQHGADKLMAEGVARVTQLGDISDAYGDKTAKDIRAGKPRIALETCMKRAEALPKPAQ
jgi:hypothetical protein